MVGVRQEHRGEPVEGQYAVRLRIFDLRRVGSLLEHRMVVVMRQRPGRLAAEDVGFQRGVDHAAPEAELREAGADVAHRLQLVPHPGRLQQRRIGAEHRRPVFLLQRLGDRLGRDHAGLHRGMRALDLGHVEEARAVADDGTTGEDQLRDGLEAALVQRARAVGDALAAFQHRRHRRVVLEALEFLEGRQPRVGVVEPHHEADRHQVVAQHVEPGPAIGVLRQRPAGRMPDQARLVLFLRDLPQLLDADAVGLRLHALAQLVGVEQLLGQGPAAALGEQGVGRAQFHARLVVRAFLAFLRDAHDAGDDAAHLAFLDDGLGGGEARVDLDAQRLGLGTQPAADIAEGDDVVPLIVHLRRRRQLVGLRLRQQHEAIVLGGRRQGGRVVAPVGDQLIQRTRFEHGAGEDVGADLAALLDQADRRVRVQLLETDRGGEARRATPHDQHVEFHRLALYGHVPAVSCNSGSM